MRLPKVVRDKLLPKEIARGEQLEDRRILEVALIAIDSSQVGDECRADTQETGK